jgi:hypothetical protein
VGHAAASPFRNDVYLTNDLDSLHLPDGTVLMDTFIGWDVWLDSSRRKQFVITSDSDFIATLNKPVHSFASLVMTIPQTGDTQSWRLYRMDDTA